jgi:ankyrin repeat protein
VNAINCEGRGALVLTVLSNSETTVRLLIEHGADIAATDSKGKNVLFAAAHNGQVSMMQLLVQRGLDVTTAVDNTGDTLLMTAVYRGHKAAAELFQGVAVSAIDNRSSTALHYAVAHCANDTAIIELLLASGADVNLRCSAVAMTEHYLTWQQRKAM